MAVATFTMQDVVDGVLNEMRFAPGRDVQIHLQSSIVQDASMLYRTLMIKFTWRDFIKMTQVTIDSTTGYPIEDITSVLDRYSNILQIYKDKDSLPLPFSPALVNPSRYNRPAILPAPVPYIFSIWPHQAMTCFLWSRTYQDADFDLADTVPFYKDILVIGTALSLATKAGINQELTAMLKEQFNGLMDTYREREIEPQYQVNQSQGAVPMEWYTYDN